MFTPYGVCKIEAIVEYACEEALVIPEREGETGRSIVWKCKLAPPFFLHTSGELVSPHFLHMCKREAQREEELARQTWRWDAS